MQCQTGDESDALAAGALIDALDAGQQDRALALLRASPDLALVAPERSLVVVRGTDCGTRNHVAIEVDTDLAHLLADTE